MESSKFISDLVANGLIRNSEVKRQPKIKPRIGLFGNPMFVRVKRSADEDVKPVSKRIKARLDEDITFLLENGSRSSAVEPQQFIDLSKDECEEANIGRQSNRNEMIITIDDDDDDDEENQNRNKDSDWFDRCSDYDGSEASELSIDTIENDIRAYPGYAVPPRDDSLDDYMEEIRRSASSRLNQVPDIDETMELSNSFDENETAQLRRCFGKTAENKIGNLSTFLRSVSQQSDDSLSSMSSIQSGWNSSSTLSSSPPSVVHSPPKQTYWITAGKWLSHSGDTPVVSRSIHSLYHRNGDLTIFQSTKSHFNY